MNHAGVAQSVVRITRNDEVGGSSPLTSTTLEEYPSTAEGGALEMR